MKRKLTFCLGLALLLLSGCGSGNSSANSGPTASAPASSAPARDSSGWDGGYGGETWNYDLPESATEPESQSVYRDANAKLIREANLTVQTEQFDQAAAALDALVGELGGYFQQASVYGGSYRDVNANRWGAYMIRVPAEKYQTFLNQAGELGYVTSKEETTEDIGERYYDAETRLKTQKTKQERLLDLLSRAKSMEDIIALESALSDVEYQIEQLSSTLNRYDSLVGFATIYLELDEVQKLSQETGATNSLSQRMGAGFARSWRNLVEGGQGLLVWLSYNLLGLCVLAAIVAGGVTAGRKIYRRRKSKTIDPPQK